MRQEEPGSRFTSRPAVAIEMGRHPEWMSAAEYGPSGPSPGVPCDATVAERAIQAVVGEWVFEPQPELGRASAVDATSGRGAAGWIPVLEWMGDQVAGELFTILGWEALRRLGKSARVIVERIKRDADAQIEVSLGMAVLLAIAHIEASGKSGPLQVEAAEETTTLGGRTPTERNYVGFEPWIIVLVSVRERHIVVIRPNGEIAGSMTFPIGEFEALYLPFEWPE